VEELITRYGVSVRRACEAMRIPRSTHNYQGRRDNQDALRMRLRELACARVRYGYRRLHVLLRREDWPINLKRVYRLYRLESLTLRRKAPRRRVSCRHRDARPAVESANQAWAMDFMSDALADGRRLRVLTVIDLYTRESLAIHADARFTSEQVVRVLEEVGRSRGSPSSIRVDNGPEFTGRMLDLWAHPNGVTLDFSRPGKPTDNGFIESFNGRLREECLTSTTSRTWTTRGGQWSRGGSSTMNGARTVPWATRPPGSLPHRRPGTARPRPTENLSFSWSKRGERLTPWL
jgi:putative transposase